MQEATLDPMHNFFGLGVKIPLSFCQKCKRLLSHILNFTKDKWWHDIVSCWRLKYFIVFFKIFIEERSLDFQSLFNFIRIEERVIVIWIEANGNVFIQIFGEIVWEYDRVCGHFGLIRADINSLLLHSLFYHFQCEVRIFFLELINQSLELNSSRNIEIHEWCHNFGQTFPVHFLIILKLRLVLLSSL